MNASFKCSPSSLKILWELVELNSDKFVVEDDHYFRCLDDLGKGEDDSFCRYNLAIVTNYFLRKASRRLLGFVVFF